MCEPSLRSSDMSIDCRGSQGACPSRNSMRLGLSSTLLVLVLAAASNASAQAEVDGCADSAVAMALDGTPLEVRVAGSTDEPVRVPLELAWCREDSDPRCQPIAPSPGHRDAAFGLDGPSYLQPEFGPTAEPMLVIMAPIQLEPRFEEAGPSGFSFGLDRPPRLR